MTIHWLRALCFVLLLAALSIMTSLAETLYAVNGDGFAALIDQYGEEVIGPGLFDSILPLIDGELYAARIPEGDYGIITAGEKQLTEFRLQAVLVVGDALLFRSDGRWGAMRADGTLLLPLTYTQIASGDGETFFVTDSDIYDSEPDELLRTRAGEIPDGTGIRLYVMEQFHDGRLLYLDGDARLYGYLDANGSVAIAPAYKTARDFAGGYAVVQGEEGLGLIDTDGNEVIECIYHWLERSDGITVGVTADGAIDVYSAPKDGCWTMDETGADVWLAGSSIALWDGQTTKVYSPDGRLIWQAIGQVHVAQGCAGQLVLSFGDHGERSVSTLSEDGSVSSQQYQGLVPLDDETYLVIGCDTTPYHSDVLDEDQLNVDLSSLRYGIMQPDGRYIFPCKARDARRVGQGIYLLKLEDKWTLIDRNGTELWEITNK